MLQDPCCDEGDIDANAGRIVETVKGCAGTSAGLGKKAGPAGQLDKVEVDVVAQGGHLWIEVSPNGLTFSGV